jgi:hypothetical protein
MFYGQRADPFFNGELVLGNLLDLTCGVDIRKAVRTHQGHKKMLDPLSKCYRPLKLFGVHISNLFQGSRVGESRLKHALLRPSTAAPRNNTSATIPFRGILVELIAGVQLGH